jgi:PAS domain S-box-containing protein
VSASFALYFDLQATHSIRILFLNSDRHQLVQQMQLIGGGAHGEEAAAAVRHFAAQNGVWTLGNFGGVPPKSAMTFSQPPTTTSLPSVQPQESNVLQQNKVEPSEYRFIFNTCGAGMAIASMGGAFLDCNQLFCQLSNYSKQEICSLTIFNLTARQDLQQAFDQISRLISPPMDVDANEQRIKPIVLRGTMKNRDDLGMIVSLVKSDDGIAKCFCVTLVKNPASPFDTSRPVPVSFDALQQTTVGETAMAKDGDDIHTTPAFTSG